MTSILKTASGIASRCGSNATLRVVAATIMAATTVWLEVWLWNWVFTFGPENPLPFLLAIFFSAASVLASLMTISFKADFPARWTLERMTGYAPFVIWSATTSDGRVTAWKLLLWPLLVPAETLVCLWLAIGWLSRLLNVDLSKM